MGTIFENSEHPVTAYPCDERIGKQRRKSDRLEWRSILRKIGCRGKHSTQKGAEPVLGDQSATAPNENIAKPQSREGASSGSQTCTEHVFSLKNSGFSLFRGVTFRVVDDNGKGDAAPPPRLCLPKTECVDLYSSKVKEGSAKDTPQAWSKGKGVSFPLQEFPLTGARASVVESRDTSVLRRRTDDGRDTTTEAQKRHKASKVRRIFSKRDRNGRTMEGAGARPASHRATLGNERLVGRYSFLLDVDAAKELPPYEIQQIHTAERSTGCLQRLYKRICRHPAYKFFPDEDLRYFDIMVTGIPVYFSSKKLERSFVLYSCPTLSGYLIGFHFFFILCTALQFILCFVVQPGFYQTWRMQLPFFFSWAISFGSIVVIILWRVTGGRTAERYNAHENKLMKADELPAGKVVQEAVHWRPCFTEDLAAVSFSLALGVPTVVSGGVIAYTYFSMKDKLQPPIPEHNLPPIFSSLSGLFGFAASQAFLALSALFLSFAVLASGIRIRKLLYVCVAVLLSSIFFHVCCSLVFYERTLLLAGILFTYSMIPVSIISRMRTERLRRFLFLLHERSQYAQQEHFEDATYGARSSTPMEELIMLINEAGLKVRHARSKYKYKKSPDLLESEAMLVRCLMILTAGGDLFAFRLNEGDDEDEKRVRDDVLDIIGSSMKDVYRASRRNALREAVPVRDVSCAPEEEDEQSQDRGADHAADAMTSFHADPLLDLWAILEVPSRRAETPVSDSPRSTAARKNDPAARSLLLASLPTFPSPRMRVAYSRRVSIDWELSMIEVETECKGWCLYRVGCDLLLYKVHGFDCSKETIKNFLKIVQLCYQQTIYHNHMHGAQVAHNTVWLARKLNLIRNLDAAEFVAFIVAALCHDIGHQGKNNSFYVTSGASVSLIYNDTAVLENFHACTTFKILARSECNIFRNQEPEVRFSLAQNLRQLLDERMNMPYEQAFRLLRTRIIELILATDMKMHFETISKFRLRRNAPDFALTAEDDRWMALRMCIKGGDLSHASLNWDSHLSWSYRATAEFYEQGDLELSQGRTISNMFDRRKHADFPKSQEGFLKYIVVPLYEELAAVDSSGAVQSECLKRLFANRERWIQLQNNPADLLTLDDEQQRIVSESNEVLQASTKTNFACTQALLRAAHRSIVEGSNKTGVSSVLGLQSPWQTTSSGRGTTGELQESVNAKLIVGGSPHANYAEDKAAAAVGKPKRKEVHRMVDVVTAVKGTVQSVAKHAAESAVKAAKEMGKTGGGATGSAEAPGAEAIAASLEHGDASLHYDESPGRASGRKIVGVHKENVHLNIESALSPQQQTDSAV